MEIANGDVISMHIHLNELKTKLDIGMRDGDVFETLKKIYMEIKELECHLHVMEWEADKRRGSSNYYSEVRNPRDEDRRPLL